jgi:PKD repeat protein
MTTVLPLIFAAIAVISFAASAQEVAYAYGDSGGWPLEGGKITEYNGTDIVTSAVAGTCPDGRTLLQESTTIDVIKREINLKLNAGNPIVKDKARDLILEYPGDGTINQICSIYEYMVGNWSYARDAWRIEEFQYSNKSLDYGKGKYSGQGDCDDSAILLAALIESVGGTPRIIFAYGPMGGHAYTEVFLGKYTGEDSDVGCMLRWLTSRYNVKEINTHSDLKTGEVWLNLDWWKEPGGAKHPGGRFFSATKQIQVYPDASKSKAYLTPVNEPPKANFSISPANPSANQNVTFNASLSKDACGRIESYRWEFGDGSFGVGTIQSHAYLRGGLFKANLTILDNDDTFANSSMTIEVNGLPVVNMRYDPRLPEIGENITFDASKSRDEDGQIAGYVWEFGDGTNSSLGRQVHHYDKRGNYTVNLTVFDDKGGQNATTEWIRVNEPPHAEMSIVPAYPNAGDEIVFNASRSSDPDGMIIEYKWDFGDGYTDAEANVSTHRYKNGGNYTVKLIIKDSDNATNESISSIKVNISPDDSYIWLSRGDELFQLGKCDEAADAYSKSYALDNSRAMALFGKGRAFFAKGKYDEALSLFMAAIELSPQYQLSNSEYADMWIYMANALKKLGRGDEADAAFAKAEDLDSSRHPELEAVVESCASDALLSLAN